MKITINSDFDNTELRVLRTLAMSQNKKSDEIYKMLVKIKQEDSAHFNKIMASLNFNDWQILIKIIKHYNLYSLDIYRPLHYKNFVVDQELARNSWNWFVESFFGKAFVKKMIKQSDDRIYSFDKYITEPELSRDAYHNGQDIRFLNKLETSDGILYYEFILLGDKLFKVTKYVKSESHIYYLMTSNTVIYE